MSAAQGIIPSGCEYEVYLKKMTSTGLHTEAATDQMMLGTLFDALVKTEIAHELGLEDASKRLDVLLDKAGNKGKQVIKPELLAVAHEVLDIYNYFGCLRRLFDEKIQDVELSVAERVHGVKLFGYPDATILVNGRVSPLDWKVSGYGSSRVKSPSAGYKSYHIQPAGTKGIAGGFQDKGRHKKYGAFLEDINIRWAIQLLFYNWMLDGRYIKSQVYSGAIDNLLLQSDGRIGVASYRANVSTDFANKIWESVRNKWERWGEPPTAEGVPPVNRGMIDLMEPKPDLWRCEPYGRAKVCTAYCEYYKRTLGDDMQREILQGQMKR